MNDVSKRFLVEDFDKVLSLGLLDAADNSGDAVDEELSKMVESLIAERNAARKEKNFARADEIRQKLLDKGIEIKDTREGTTWSVI